jgi:hypothetical protein
MNKGTTSTSRYGVSTTIIRTSEYEYAPPKGGVRTSYLLTVRWAAWGLAFALCVLACSTAYLLVLTHEETQRLVKKVVLARERPVEIPSV